MVVRTSVALTSLYMEDETAWLETMAGLIAEHRFQDLDYEHLGEYLSDMAQRDRREVDSRMTVLLAHLLKWEFQPEKRSGSWRATILDQGNELRQCLESGTLRNHAIAGLPKSYQKARKLAAAETGLPIATFPAESSRSVDTLIADKSEVDPD